MVVSTPRIIPFLKRVTINVLKDLGRTLGSEEKGGLGLGGLEERKKREKERKERILNDPDYQEIDDFGKEKKRGAIHTSIYIEREDGGSDDGIVDEILFDEKKISEIYKTHLAHDLRKFVTPRQLNILIELIYDLPISKIASRLAVSEKTVDRDIEAMGIKTGLKKYLKEQSACLKTMSGYPASPG